MKGFASQPTILHTDEDGFVVRKASIAAIQGAWRDPLDFVIERCKDHLGSCLHSFYVRGSVANGQARNDISDIDCIVIYEDNAKKLDANWRRDVKMGIKQSWPFVRSVDLVAYSQSSLIEPGHLAAAVIKSQAVCIHGTDVSLSLPSVRLGIDMVIDGWCLPESIAIAERLQDESFDLETAAKARAWASKKIVRTGFELIMRQANCFTRDLVTCSEMFRNHCPEKWDQISDALAFSLHKEEDTANFVRLIAFTNDWLYPEVCREYGAERLAQITTRG